MRATKPPRKSVTKALRTYRHKRNFAESPEPSGEAPKSLSKGKNIFCVQKHLATALHYDFRLEHNGVLLSWAVPKGPSLNPKDKRLAMRVEDHPFDYAEFEGVIPSGYGAGVVMLWDRGTWQPLDEDVDRALEKGELKFTLDGVKLKGSWVLVRLKDSKTWLLIKHRDEWSGDIDIATFAPRSVKSDEDLEGILKREKPDVWLSKGVTEAHLDEKFKRAISRLPAAAGASRTKTPAARTRKKRKTRA
jgi:bifunctional non-homologous end joining protein LigD